MVHLGVPYDTPEALVESVGPWVADALSRGEDAYLSVDRRTARGFREWLGPASERAQYPSPVHWPRDLVRDLRSIVRPGRRALVVGQYTSVAVPTEEPAHREDSANLVLSDLPLTVLCCCRTDADPALLATLHAGHASLLVNGSVVPNVGYRAPVSSQPIGGALWGPPTLRLDFRAPEDLHRLREHVTRAAESLGLRGETVGEAVLATHEAAMLAAGGAVPEPDADADPVPCVLEVRIGAGALYCEVVAPRPTDGSRTEADPLRIVRLFCDRALLHDDADVRMVQVLRSPDGSRAPAA